MRLTVDLDRKWEDDYGETSIALMIKDEINRAIRAEVRAAIRKIVHGEVEDLTKKLQREFAQLKSDQTMPILELLVKLTEVKNSL